MTKGLGNSGAGFLEKVLEPSPSSSSQQSCLLRVKNVTNWGSSCWTIFNLLDLIGREQKESVLLL